MKKFPFAVFIWLFHSLCRHWNFRVQTPLGIPSSETVSITNKSVEGPITGVTWAMALPVDLLTTIVCPATHHWGTRVGNLTVLFLPSPVHLCISWVLWRNRIHRNMQLYKGITEAYRIRDGSPQWLSVGSEAGETDNSSVKVEAAEQGSRMQFQPTQRPGSLLENSLG